MEVAISGVQKFDYTILKFSILLLIEISIKEWKAHIMDTYDARFTNKISILLCVSLIQQMRQGIQCKI